MLLLTASVAPGSLHPYFSSIKRFLNAVVGPDQQEISQVRGVDYLNFAASSNSRIAGHVRTFLRKWHGLNADGLAADVLSTLRATKIEVPLKGVAVATMDPKQGPFTDIEFQALQDALSKSYVVGTLRTSIFVMTWLFIATGARPIQLAAMKVKDVHGASVEGATDYSIDVPSVKKGAHIRLQFRNRPLVKTIGSLLVKYADAVRVSFEGKLEGPQEAPLFPAASHRKAWAPGFEHHRTSYNISKEICTALSGLNVISERTGQPMHVTPVRLRRTFGTRAAQEGHGLLVIAELLDHADTQNAGVYVESRPDIAARIDKATAFELAPIAQAFAGKLLRTEREATRAGDKSSRIRDLRIAVEPLASCGQHSYCGMSAPGACYTCENFEPWIDGPHEAMLDFLLDRRARQLADGDARIATVLDRTILAVAHVVQLCKVASGGLDAPQSAGNEPGLRLLEGDGTES
jgi:integrase